MVRAITVFSFATSISAYTISSSSSSSSSSSFSSLSEIKNVLSSDEMIYFGGDGGIRIIRRSEYANYTRGMSAETAKQLYQKRNEKIDGNPEDSKIQKHCEQHQVFAMKPVQTYVDWDVPMSGVLLAPPDSPATIGVNEGFSISNSFTASATANFNLIKNFMKSTFDISSTRTWLATDMGDYKFSVPPGKFGAVVINPITIRHSGYLDVGCIGQANRTEFSSESYQSKSYSDMLWVEGLIGLCVGDTYPLKMCFGEDTL
ncbi:hypothetical protein Golomagni_02936 [Golovinomyces magnicellulatus]|nr:hypothetical protein Golomagni_02936 [Golovinomyces magnicellulatus]